MSLHAASALVSTEWLADHITAPDLRIVDATWDMPFKQRNLRAEYAAAHIRGAVYADIDDIADPASPLPHAVPDATLFASRMRKLGIGDGNRVVVYDSNNYCASARMWWLLRLFGHEDVAVLDGGLSKWQAEGRPLSDTPPSPRERHFTTRENTLLLRDLEQMRSNVARRREQVLDARSAGRFNGTEPEPWPGLRSGRIPGSRNLPFVDLIATETATLKPRPALQALFNDIGVDLDQPLVTSCGSGVTACVLALAAYELGHRDVAVYDGSWTEWAARSDTPIAK